MMDTTHGLLYPPGVRPFKSQAEHSELDDVLGDCMNSDFMVSIVLPKGFIAKAMDIVQHKCVTVMKAALIEGLKAYVQNQQSSLST
jgi:hypothetical protein